MKPSSGHIPRSAARAILAAAIGICVPTGALAAEILVTYRGFVSGIDSGGIFGDPGAHLANTNFAASFVFDPDVGAMTNTANAARWDGFYRSAAVTIAGKTHSLQAASGYMLVNDFPTFSPPDGAFLYAYSAGGAGRPAGYINVGLVGEFFDQPNFGNLRQSYPVGVLSSYMPAMGTFLQLRTHELEISPVAAAVPEPSTWGMLIVGFGAVGLGMRSSRRKGNALAAV